jgi:hypothetical protein
LLLSCLHFCLPQGIKTVRRDNREPCARWWPRTRIRS